MLPNLEFAGLRMPTGGLLLAIAFLAGILLARHRARKAGIDPRKTMYLVIWMLAGLALGSKVLFYVLNRPEGLTLAEKLRFFQISGLRLYGGLPVAAVIARAHCRGQQQPFWKTMDVVTPSFLLGLFLLRIGCFCNGCCYGVATELPWGMDFVAGRAAEYQESWGNSGIPLHPTQLYAAAYGLLFFLLSLVIDRRKPFAGFTVLAMLALYGAARFLIEFVRHYHDDRGLWYGVTHNQVWSILLTAFSLAVLLTLWRNPRELDVRDVPQEVDR